MQGLAAPAVAIFAGSLHSAALLDTGAVQVWGANSNGQLGLGTRSHSLTPRTLTALATRAVLSLSLGWRHSLAVLASGDNSDGLHPTPYTLNPEPYTLNPEPYTLNPQPSTLHPQPYTLHPTPYTLHPTPSTLHPTPSTLNPETYTLHPQPYTLNLHPEPYTLNPTP